MKQKGTLIGLALVGLTLLPFHFPFDKTVACTVGIGLGLTLSRLGIYK